jgi:hypothetical protein
MGARRDDHHVEQLVYAGHRDDRWCAGLALGFNLAANAPDDATSGLTNFVYALIYTYETWLLPMLLVGGGLVTTAGVLA